MPKWLVIAILAAAAFWAYKHRDRFLPASKEAPKPAAESALSQASREAADAGSSGGGITDRMSPDDVRRVLGPPDDVSSGTTDTGHPYERWTYRSVGKVVVFEDGVVARVERP